MMGEARGAVQASRAAASRTVRVTDDNDHDSKQHHCSDAFPRPGEPDIRLSPFWQRIGTAAAAPSARPSSVRMHPEPVRFTLAGSMRLSLALIS
jgi:hypothetical protein